MSLPDPALPQRETDAVYANEVVDSSSESGPVDLFPATGVEQNTIASLSAEESDAAPQQETNAEYQNEDTLIDLDFFDFGEAQQDMEPRDLEPWTGLERATEGGFLPQGPAGLGLGGSNHGADNSLSQMHCLTSPPPPPDPQAQAADMLATTSQPTIPANASYSVTTSEQQLTSQSGTDIDSADPAVAGSNHGADNSLYQRQNQMVCPLLAQREPALLNRMMLLLPSLGACIPSQPGKWENKPGSLNRDPKIAVALWALRKMYTSATWGHMIDSSGLPGMFHHSRKTILSRLQYYCAYGDDTTKSIRHLRPVNDELVRQVETQYLPHIISFLQNADNNESRPVTAKPRAGLQNSEFSLPKKPKLESWPVGQHTAAVVAQDTSSPQSNESSATIPGPESPFARTIFFRHEAPSASLQQWASSHGHSMCAAIQDIHQAADWLTMDFRGLLEYTQRQYSSKFQNVHLLYMSCNLSVLAPTTDRKFPIRCEQEWKEAKRQFQGSSSLELLVQECTCRHPLDRHSEPSKRRTFHALSNGLGTAKCCKILDNQA